jgi:hypothetical protein
MDDTTDAPAGPAAEPPPKASHRTRWIAGAAAVAVVGLGVAVALSKHGASSPSVVVALPKSSTPSLSGVSRSVGRTLDHQVSVQGHQRLQAYGPKYQHHRPIEIQPYLRGPALAA